MCRELVTPSRVQALMMAEDQQAEPCNPPLVSSSVEGQTAVRTRREYGKAGDPVVILRRRFGGSEAGLGEAQNCRSVGDAKEAGRMEQHNHLPPGDGRAVVPAGEHRAQPFWSRIVVESGKPMLPAT
jgi:hypothetical protein